MTTTKLNLIRQVLAKKKSTEKKKGNMAILVHTINGIEYKGRKASAALIQRLRNDPSVNVIEVGKTK